jgi:hypothetical protein
MRPRIGRLDHFPVVGVQGYLQGNQPCAPEFSKINQIILYQVFKHDPLPISLEAGHINMDKLPGK